MIGINAKNGLDSCELQGSKGVQEASKILSGLAARMARGEDITLEECAKEIGATAPDLMSALVVHELNEKPLAAALIAGVDGCAVVKRAGDGEFSITVPTVLARVLLAGLLHDPRANASICVPLPPVASTGTN